MNKSKRTQIHPAQGKDGFKSMDHWLAEALGAKWTRRGGYTVASEERARLFRFLSLHKVAASRRILANDKSPYTFTLSGSHDEMPLSEVKKKLGYRPESELSKQMGKILNEISYGRESYEDNFASAPESKPRHYSPFEDPMEYHESFAK